MKDYSDSLADGLFNDVVSNMPDLVGELYNMAMDLQYPNAAKMYFTDTKKRPATLLMLGFRLAKLIAWDLSVDEQANALTVKIPRFHIRYFYALAKKNDLAVIGEMSGVITYK